jgi:thioester reductase-like protein
LCLYCKKALKVSIARLAKASRELSPYRALRHISSKITRSMKTIFVTGFPGFIAGRLIELLAQDDNARFLLLVEPRFGARARAEIARLAQKTAGDRDRFHLLEGDITQPQLGLSTMEFERAREETTALFHLAAIYDLAVARDVAMRVNVEGTRNVNRFALKLPRLERYHYVSTCYVAGKRTGLIRETELEHSAGFRNFYEESKYLAELEVDRLKDCLPITIYRPAVVCGDSKTGETTKYDGIYYLINYILMQPDLLSLVNIGNKRVRLNVVPVDFVVRAMATLARDERAVGATVHLADPEPLTTYDLFETIAEAAAGHGSRLHVPPTLVRSTLQLPFSETITGLPRVGVPYFFIEQIYDTTRARELLEPHGVVCPAFPSYVHALIAYVRAHPQP